MSTGITVVSPDPARRAGLTALLNQAGPLQRRSAGTRPVVVFDHDLGRDTEVVAAVERLSRRNAVIGLADRLVRPDVWMLRSCGARGFLAYPHDASRTARAVKVVAAGGQYWPAALGTAPGWLGEPLDRRVYSYLKDREQAELDRVTEDVLETLDGLASAPGVGPEARRILAVEADRMRRLSAGADDERHPPGGPAAALTALADRYAGLLRVDVALRWADEPDCDPRTLPVVVAAAGEALRNVVKHAGAGRARLAASVEDQVLTVSVADDGTGFDPRTPAPGFGLDESIQERMRSIGGEALVASEVGRGTTVTLRVSLHR